jgi:glycosyltransferase 2 family protein
LLGIHHNLHKQVLGYHFHVESPPKRPRVKLYTVVSLTLSILIIGLVLYFTISPATIRELRQVHIHYEFFLIAIALNIFSWVLWGWRLQVLSHALDPSVHISIWEGTRIVIANLFLAGITPAMAGGEPLRIYLLKEDGMSVGGATAAVVGERLIDALCLLILIPIAFLIFQDKLNNPILTVGLIIGVVFFIIFIILFLYAVKYPEKSKKFLISLTKRFTRLRKKKSEEDSVKLLSFITREVDSFHSGMAFFVGKGKRAFLYVSLLTVAYWGISFMIPTMLLLGLGLPPYVIESYAAQLLLLVIVLLPTTPGSSGIAEISISGLYGVIIGSAYNYLLGVFVLLFRLITYHMNLIAGAIFQYRIFKSVTSFTFDTLTKED